MIRIFIALFWLGAAIVPAHAQPNSIDAKTTYPPLPRAVSSFGAAISDGWVYIYGGHCSPTHSYSTEAVVGTFHRLKIADPKAWEELPPGPALQGLAVVAYQGKIYRIGGMHPKNAPGTKADTHSVATCAVFDPATKKWDSLPDLPKPRSSHDAVIVGDKLIVVGGWQLNGTGKKSDWHDDTLILDLKKQPLQWQSVQQPFVRRALTTAVHDDKVYVVGGIGDDNVTELTVNIYDPAKNAWSLGLDIPTPRRNGFSPAAISNGGRFYVNPADGRMLRLTVKGDAWEDVGLLKQPRIVHRMIAVQPNLLLALGGANKGGNVALSEAVVPPDGPGRLIAPAK